MFGTDLLAFELTFEQVDQIGIAALVICVICTVGFIRLAMRSSAGMSVPVALILGTVCGFAAMVLVQDVGHRLDIFVKPSSTLSDVMVGLYTWIAVGPASGWLILCLWVGLSRRYRDSHRILRGGPPDAHSSFG